MKLMQVEIQFLQKKCMCKVSISFGYFFVLKIYRVVTVDQASLAPILRDIGPSQSAKIYL